MLLSGRVPHTRNSRHLFWNQKDPALAQTLPYGRKITYHPLLIEFSKNLISVLDVRHDALHVNVVQQPP